MRKKDIARVVAGRAGVTQAQALDIVRGVLDEVIGTLAAAGRIELRNFGVFEVRRRKPRKARNTRTGTTVTVPAPVVVTFQLGLAMAGRVAQATRGGVGLMADLPGNRAAEGE
jgi:nucleoid DNA-binding protein